LPNVLGLPLETAKELLREAGIPSEVIIYQAKRELECADDLRVLRCGKKGDGVLLVVSAFSTAV